MNVTISGWTVPICSSTSLCNLENGCNSPNPADGVTCQCDPSCLFFGDCCADYLEECSSNVPQSGPFLEATDGIASDQLSCMVPPHSTSSGNDTGYLLVNKCDATWRNEKTRDLCEGSAQEDDLFSLTPVSLGDRLGFKNVYCAICNRKDLAELSAWSFQAEFDANSTNMTNVSSNVTNSQQVEILMSSCSKWYFVPQFPGSGATRICNEELVNPCQVQEGVETPSALQTVCNSFIAETVINGNTSQQYRNPVCLLCDSVGGNDAFSPFHDISCQSSDADESGGEEVGFCTHTN